MQCYSRMMLYYNRVAIVVGIHNLGSMVFYATVFGELGMNLSPTIGTFLEKKVKKQAYYCAYYKHQHVKHQHKYKFQSMLWEQVFEARTKADGDYGCGMGLHLGTSQKRNATEEGDGSGN